MCGTAREARGKYLVDTTIAIDTITSGNGLEAACCAGKLKICSSSVKSMVRWCQYTLT